MNTRFGFLKVATFVAVAAAVLSPAAMQAQTNRGQVVQAVVKLNQATLAFAKKLAEDGQFAAQFDKATASGNYDAAASLAASVTGLAKSNIHLSSGPVDGNDDHDAVSAAPTQSVYKLASFSRHNERMVTTGKICFNLGVVAGCIGW